MREYNIKNIRLQEMRLIYNKLDRLISDRNQISLWGRYDVLTFSRKIYAKITKILITYEEEIFQQIFKK